MQDLQFLDESVPAVEEVLDRTLSEWRHSFPTSAFDPWQQRRLAASKALLLLQAGAPHRPLPS